jgi:dihydroorotate dehydrogenase subfamily 1
MAKLDQTICGLHFKSPIVISSGPLTDSVDKIKMAEECGAGAVSTKVSRYFDPVPGVRKMYTQKGLYLINPSDRRFSLDTGMELVRNAKEAVNIPVFANVAGGGSTESWVYMCKGLEEAGADAVELNLACPNTDPDPSGELIGHGASMSANPDAAALVVSEIKKSVKIPVWVKFSGAAANVPLLTSAVEKAGGDGVVAFYSPRGAFPVDIFNGGRPGMAAMDKCSFGGINGPAIKPMSNRVIAESAMSCSLPVIGGGGISDYADAVTSIMYGASLAFVCTKVLTDGFGVITKMCSDINDFLDQQGYDDIADIRGLSLRYVVTQAELDNSIGPKAKIDESKCAGCGACTKIGSCTALSLKGKKAAVQEEKCESCGLCSSLCPKSAIYF